VDLIKTVFVIYSFCRVTHTYVTHYAHMKYKKQFINTTNEPVELPSFFWQIEKVTSGISLQNTVALLIMAVSYFICIQNA